MTSTVRNDGIQIGLVVRRVVLRLLEYIITLERLQHTTQIIFDSKLTSARI